MKKLLIGIVVVFAVIMVIILLAFRLTKGITESADQFFSLVKGDRIEEAYLSTSKEFKAATSKNKLRAFLADTTLGDFEGASWSSRSITNNIGKLEGSINTKGGGVVPMEIEFIKEGGSWKILALRKASAGLIEKDAEREKATAVKEVPSDKVIINMLNESILILAKDINRNNFSAFYNFVAKIWQNQTDKDALRSIFGEFIDKKIDLTIIEKETPIISEKPYIDDDGILRLTGYYATKPYMVHFELKYTYEHPRWKLVGINIRTK